MLLTILVGLWLALESILRTRFRLVSLPADRDSLRYVRDGIPLIARIRLLELVRTSREKKMKKTGFSLVDFNNLLPDAHADAMAGIGEETAAFAFRALYEYRDPISNTVQTATDTSAEQDGDGNDFTTSFGEGDYLTAVYLPIAGTGTLHLYIFLGLRSNSGVVRKTGKP
jgi:hypothetical protein